jgi:hypothetical protein
VKFYYISLRGIYERYSNPARNHQTGLLLFTFSDDPSIGGFVITIDGSFNFCFKE